MNRFIIKNENICNLDRIKPFIDVLSSDYNKVIVILEDITNDEYVQFKDGIFKDDKFLLFNGVHENLKFISEYQTTKYINSIDQDADQEVIDSFFNLKMYGYKASRLRSLSLYYLNVDEKDILHIHDLNDKQVFESDFDINRIIEFIYSYCSENRFVSKMGLCRNCRNPLCDMNKGDEIDIPFLISLKECEKRIELRSKVSEEVSEVKKEDYLYLMELILDIRNNSDIVAENVLSKLAEIKGSKEV